MDNLVLDQRQVLPENSQARVSLDRATSPVRTIRWLADHYRRSSRVNNEIAIIKPVESSDDPSSPVSPTEYGYLQNIQSYKALCTPDDKSLPKKVR